MPQSTDHLLTVPGARLHHERLGDGPPLLLIHGGGGDAGAMERLAAELAPRRSLILYDRRGYGRSPLTPAPGDDPFAGYGIPRDADDAALLVEGLVGTAVDVFASSSGALVGLDLLARRPDLIRTMVAHEPPLVTLLPDAAELLALLEEIHSLYVTQGLDAAMRRHLTAIGMAQPAAAGPPPGMQLPPHLREMLDRMPANQRLLMEREVLGSPQYRPDLDALAALPDLPHRLVLAGGRDARDVYPYRAVQELARRLGLALADFPGDHIGYVLHPAEFAPRLEQVLADPPPAP